MTRFVEWIKGFALVWGGPGLFLIGFLDSSFLSFPEVNDLLIVWMVAQHKERLLYYTRPFCAVVFTNVTSTAA